MENAVDKLLKISKSREFLLFCAIFILYTANQSVINSTDSIPARILPISIIREHNFDLNEFTFLYESKDRLPYYLKKVDDRIVSTYPVFTALLATPVYLLPVLMGLDAQSNNVILLAKISAALMTTISCLFIYWTLKRRTREKIALLITGIYAFGTMNWPISSQDLLQHGPGELFIAIAIYLLTRGLKEEKYIKYAGFTLAWAVAIRPPNAVIALVLSAYVLMEHRKQFLNFLLCATPVAFIMFAYSMKYLHSILLLGQMVNPASGWDTPLLEGFRGLLLSPNKGLLPHSPVLVISIAGMLCALRDSKENLMKYFALAVMATIVMWSKWGWWFGGLNYGPRMLIEILPFLCLFLARPVEAMLEKRGLRVILAVLIAISVFINFLGVSAVDYSWNRKQLDEKIALGDREALNKFWWNTSDMEIVYYAKRFLSGAG